VQLGRLMFVWHMNSCGLWRWCVCVCVCVWVVLQIVACGARTYNDSDNRDHSNSTPAAKFGCARLCPSEVAHAARTEHVWQAPQKRQCRDGESACRQDVRMHAATCV